jgi:DNA-binding transcriptional regulator LsrR (DeoR family)
MVARTKLTPLMRKQVALLLAQGRTQKEIAGQLGLGQTTVSRARIRALEEGVLLDIHRCTLSREEIEELEQLLYCPELLATLQKETEASANLMRLRIFDAGRSARRTSREQYAHYRDRFGAQVAEHMLANVFPKIRSVGVTWGSTLLSVVRGIESSDASRLRLHGAEFFPVCGAPPDAIEEALRSSSSLVAALDERLNGAIRNANNFSGVAASISCQFRGAELKVLEKYFRENEGYCRVFGLDGRRGLIDAMDAVLTSVGTANPDENPWIAGAARAAGVDLTRLSDSVCGSVGGLFLPRQGLDARSLKMVEAVNARWTGIRLQHFLDCNARSRSKGSGGTVLIALGVKVDIVMACVRAGLVSELLIDAELAVGLGRACGCALPDHAAADGNGTEAREYGT